MHDVAFRVGHAPSLDQNKKCMICLGVDDHYLVLAFWCLSIGNYFIDPDEGSPHNAIQAMCNFDTETAKTCVEVTPTILMYSRVLVCLCGYACVHWDMCMHEYVHS